MTELQNKIDTATDNNEHTEAVMIAAREIPGEVGQAFLTILQEIDDRHMLRGSITENDQQLRRFIEKDCHETLRLQGKL